MGFFASFFLGVVGLIKGGVFVGLTLGLFGVLVTYLSSKDKNLHKWAWMGVGTYAALIVLFILVLLLTWDFN
jgi:bacteriorhodopsin